MGKPVKRTEPNVPLAVGQLCLLDMKKYAGYWPLVGEVVEIKSNKKVLISWYIGTLKSVFKPWLIKKQGIKKPWLEEVDRDEIWYNGFQLTKKGRLRSPLQEKIKEKMEIS